MMVFSKKIRILFVLDFALIVLIVLGLVLSPASNAKRSSAFDLLKDVESVASIRITGKDSVDLTRSGDVWTLGGDDGALPADSGRVKLFLEALDAVDSREFVARNKEAWPKFGLEGEHANRVQLGDKDGANLKTFILGSYAQAPGMVYVSEPDSPAAYAVSSGMASYVLGGRNSWLDLRMWSSPPAVEQVQEFTLQGQITLKGNVVSSYRAIRSKGSWESGGNTLDANKVESVLRALINIRGSDYAPVDESLGTQLIGVELVLGNGTSLRFSIGVPKPDGKYPALSSQRDRIVYLPAWTIEEAVKPVSALR
jgi:hypothetical protein